ncbi:hypothetical protein [Desulfonatronovibrio magnus]|uniref:hypothetical protein n=1 Tax=Desulfonatronovibrio magnus TaxID=698827 RepID=UPI0005EB18D7|nr:hypothetical protein [Desulfonatronovibrio magnus]
MLFHFRIFLCALKEKKKYLGLIVIPSILYLLVSAYIPYEYHIVQDMNAEGSTLLALGPNPMEMNTVENVVHRPDILFTDNLALMDLRNHLLVSGDLHRPEWASWLPSSFAVFVQRAVQGSFSLTSGSNNHFALEYKGPDKDLGMAMVSFYSHRLITGSSRAAERTLIMAAMEMGASGIESGVIMAGPVNITASRVWYAPERNLPALWILGISAFLILSLMWGHQYLNPRLYTPRQASRYLQTRVLGTVPNLNKLKFN